MSRYDLIVSPEAERQLARIKDRRVLLRLRAAIFALVDDPRPNGVKKLVGEADQWRVRVGDWRVIYRIEDGRLVVVVLRVAPRGGAYRGG